MPTKGSFKSTMTVKAATVLGALHYLHRIKIMGLLLHFLLPNLVQSLPCGQHQHGIMLQGILGNVVLGQLR